MKPKLVWTPQQRMEAIRFIIYELWMLVECLDMPKPRNQPEKNVWYEALVLHTRVLRDFFFRKLNKDGKDATRPCDILAYHYFQGEKSSWPYTSIDLPKYLKANSERMDRALAHLSFDRLNYKKDWSAEDIRSEIGDKWFEFVEKLQALNEPAAKPFLELAKRKKLPLSGTLAKSQNDAWLDAAARATIHKEGSA